MSYKPAHFPDLTPYLTVKNAEKAIEFYKQAFGFQEGHEPIKDENGVITHANMTRDNVVIIMFGPENAYGSVAKTPKTLGIAPSTTLYIYCQDTDSLYNQAIKNGAVSLMEPQDSFWGDRFCKLQDPDGHEWMFATHLGQ